MNQQLLDRIKSSPQLPSLPAVAIRALELARQENVDLSEIAELISNDPALSSKILKTVNSPFYGLPKQVATISHALVILGLQAVKTLALGFSLVTNLRNSGEGGDSFDYMRFWKRSIYTAVAGRLLARKIGIVQQEEAFLAGLLADVGMLVMHRVMPHEYDAIHAGAKNQEDLVQRCQAAFGLDHCTVGAYLGEQWQLPPVLTRPIACHHHPAEVDPQLKTLCEIVYIAGIVGEFFSNDEPVPYVVRARQEMRERLGCSPEEIETLLEEIGSSTRDVAKLFEVNIGRDRSYQEILDEAQQALVRLSLESQQQVQTIKREVESLQVKAATDPLTGLANRARFGEFFEEQFNRAYKLQRPLALLFIDVDHFKMINDTHGHQGGDEVLRYLGRLLKGAVRNIDLAARYGGEEFALVLTETDLNGAARLADEIRMAVQSESIRFEGKDIRTTVSIGVAGTERLRVFTIPAQLTGAADRAVYAAKSAGRNCVRLFRPKVPSIPPGKIVQAAG